MPTWNDLLNEVLAVDAARRSEWLGTNLHSQLDEIGKLRGDRNAILMASGFLNKLDVPAAMISITSEDINGLMAMIHGMDCSKGLTLILHTPGGSLDATQTIVGYLWSKFTDIEVIVPTYAMSAGTMISLAANRIVMGRQSQLGPIDPQMQVDGQSRSARAIVEQFKKAKLDIVGDPSQGIPGDVAMASVWAPVLSTIGPSLYQESQNALDYSEKMVAGWLAQRMKAGEPDPAGAGAAIAHHFNDASLHLSHGRRIDRDEARGQGVIIEDLEDNQALQEAVLTTYHLATITLDNSPIVKLLGSTTGADWLKMWPVQNLTAEQPGPAKKPLTRAANPANLDRNPPRPRKGGKRR